MIKDKLGDRIKHNYEEASKMRLTRRMPVIIRLDGKAFHTFTHGFKKPFDEVFNKAMQSTMKYLCENIQGCVLGYTQSDEITLVLIDYQTLETSAWFDYEVQKMCSVSASMATLAFNKYFNEYYLESIAEKCGELDSYDLAHDAARRKGAMFDSRCFNIPKEEVTNCILWRQLDAERNSINTLAQSLFSHKSLQGLGRKEIIAKMETEKGVTWENLPTTQKRGSCCVKKTEVAKEWVEDVGNNLGVVHREYNSYWFVDNEIPLFKEEGRNYIEKLIAVGEQHDKFIIRLRIT